MQDHEPGTAPQVQKDPGPASASAREKRPAGRGRRALLALLRLLFCLALATGAGAAGALAYLKQVDPPPSGHPPRHQSHPLGEIPPPLSTAKAGVAIDPVRQAMEMARSSLAPGALLKLEAQVQGGIVTLSGEVDSLRTAALAASTVGKLGGVVAVDTRAVKVASRTHVIRPGDQPALITRRYYGDSCGWRRILEANPKVDPASLKVGKTLIIPPRER